MKHFAKKIISLFICIVMFFSIFPSNIFETKVGAASFSDINKSNVFLQQEGDRTCTLCSNVMLLRRTSMMRGDSNWSSITESSAKSQLWTTGGQYINYTFSKPDKQVDQNKNNSSTIKHTGHEL